VITVPNIEPSPSAQLSNKGGRQARSGASLQPVEAAGRALATQRDALFFRSEAILRLGGPVQAPYLAQQIGQLWHSATPASHKAAFDAYQKHSPFSDSGDDHQASLLA